jgi:hypothetical protein
MASMADALIPVLCFALGASVGVLVGLRARDGYWLLAARTGTRAECRGKLYVVTEAKL